jgi:hypothetical protein
MCVYVKWLIFDWVLTSAVVYRGATNKVKRSLASVRSSIHRLAFGCLVEPLLLTMSKLYLLLRNIATFLARCGTYQLHRCLNLSVDLKRSLIGWHLNTDNWRSLPLQERIILCKLPGVHLGLWWHNHRHRIYASTFQGEVCQLIFKELFSILCGTAILFRLVVIPRPFYLGNVNWTDKLWHHSTLQVLTWACERPTLDALMWHNVWTVQRWLRAGEVGRLSLFDLGFL